MAKCLNRKLSVSIDPKTSEDELYKMDETMTKTSSDPVLTEDSHPHINTMIMILTSTQPGCFSQKHNGNIPEDTPRVFFCFYMKL